MAKYSIESVVVDQSPHLPDSISRCKRTQIVRKSDPIPVKILELESIDQSTPIVTSEKITTDNETQLAFKKAGVLDQVFEFLPLKRTRSPSRAVLKSFSTLIVSGSAYLNDQADITIIK